ncbi:hypothetical protein CYMTET_31981 [Cymbomonas tetramitiformis]|uniref:SAP domain-containing protein n=1 Tax=Cymbomonas tetramitiformis TaxID=36881 RepID=A0AAE0FGK3_9CHLO|nr:hypothetical protein CYMTET_31981 [Cymbomonas tetramitiformis]
MSTLLDETPHTVHDPTIVQQETLAHVCYQYKRPPAKLVAEVIALDNLTATQLVEHFKLRRVGVSGNKTLLKSRLIKAIAKVARTQPSHLATTDGVAHDTRPVGAAHGTDVPVTIQQVPHTGPELPPKTPRPPTSKKKKPDAISESPWVSITQQQAASSRWTRPEYEGPERGQPSAKANRLLNPLTSTPIDYFAAYIPDIERYSKWKTHSNIYATCSGASTDSYPNFTPFSGADIDLIIGLHVRNGVAPTPDMRFNFMNPETSFVFGDRRVISCVQGGFRRFKEFKAFFHIHSGSSDRCTCLQIFLEG